MPFLSLTRRHSSGSLSARAFSLALLTATVSSPSAFAAVNQAVSATTDERSIRTAQVASALHVGVDESIRPMLKRLTRPMGSDGKMQFPRRISITLSPS